jgi:monoamine oxidase
MAASHPRPRQRVVIIGGGIAGLSAGTSLQVLLSDAPASDLAVTILEAADRVGGRTCSQAVASAAVHGHTAHIDVGGQWIGEHQSAARSLAEELGIRLWPQYCAGRRVIQIGDRVATYSGLIPNMSVGQLLDAQVVLSLLSLFRLVLWAFPAFAAWCDRTAMEDMRARLMWTEGGRALLRIVVLGLFGAEPAAVSVLAFIRYVNASGGSVEAMSEIGPGSVQAYTCVGGSQQISLKLADRFVAAGGTIRFGRRVVGIARATPTPVAAEAGHGDAPIRVTCAGGEEFAADHVIIALPPALAAAFTFSPPLPEHRAGLMSESAMGCIIKAIAVYDAPFWREAGFSGEVIADTTLPSVGPVFNAFDNAVPVTASTPGAPAAPSAAAAGVPRWQPPLDADGATRILPALVGFINGDKAAEWSSSPPEERRKAVLQQFARWFGPRALAPVEFIEKDWVADPFTRGCPIASYGRGVLGRFGLARQLREPCWPEAFAGGRGRGRGSGGAAGASSASSSAAVSTAATTIHRLHWAGTETAEVGTGFMDGAIRSGRTAAQEVAADIRAAAGAGPGVVVATDISSGGSHSGSGGGGGGGGEAGASSGGEGRSVGGAVGTPLLASG